MPRVDFLISNDRHHVEMFEPVLPLLAATPGYECRVISLCEFRGLETPHERFAALNVPVIQLSPRFRSTSSSGAQKGGAAAKQSRKLMRRLSWQVILRRPVARWLASKPDLVILGNDSAFPYDRITAQLRQKRIEFLLVQEGIRFKAPAGEDFDLYGKSGARAVAAWGKSSAAFFQAQGVSEKRIFLTGNPRFDRLADKDWTHESAEQKRKLGLGTQTLLFLSNPIDDQGFCTTVEKINLIRRFAEGVGGLFRDPNFMLVLKLHGRESAQDVTAALADLPYHDRIVITKDTPLYPLFGLAQAAVVLASTVGLEALLFGVPLGVMEIPPHGFAFDYVTNGGAIGLSASRPLEAQVRELLTSGGTAQHAVAAYLDNALAHRGESGKEIAGLVKALLGNREQSNVGALR